MFITKKFFACCERVFLFFLLSCAAFFIACFVGLSSLSFGMQGMQDIQGIQVVQGMASSQKGNHKSQSRNNMHRIDLEVQNHNLDNDENNYGYGVNALQQSTQQETEKINFQSHVYGKIIDSKKGLCDRLKSGVARFYRTSQEMEDEFRNYPLDKVYREINKQQVRSCKLTFVLKILDSLLIPAAISLIVYINKQC